MYCTCYIPCSASFRRAPGGKFAWKTGDYKPPLFWNAKGGNRRPALWQKCIDITSLHNEPKLVRRSFMRRLQQASCQSFPASTYPPFVVGRSRGRLQTPLGGVGGCLKQKVLKGLERSTAVESLVQCHYEQRVALHDITSLHNEPKLVRRSFMRRLQQASCQSFPASTYPPFVVGRSRGRLQTP